jgi:hypothetical protein
MPSLTRVNEHGWDAATGGWDRRPCPSYQQQTKGTLLLGKGERD